MEAFMWPTSWKCEVTKNQAAIAALAASTGAGRFCETGGLGLEGHTAAEAGIGAVTEAHLQAQEPDHSGMVNYIRHQSRTAQIQNPWLIRKATAASRQTKIDSYRDADGIEPGDKVAYNTVIELLKANTEWTKVPGNIDRFMLVARSKQNWARLAYGLKNGWSPEDVIRLQDGAIEAFPGTYAQFRQFEQQGGDPGIFRSIGGVPRTTFAALLGRDLGEGNAKKWRQYAAACRLESGATYASELLDGRNMDEALEIATATAMGSLNPSELAQYPLTKTMLGEMEWDYDTLGEAMDTVKGLTERANADRKGTIEEVGETTPKYFHNARASEATRKLQQKLQVAEELRRTFVKDGTGGDALRAAAKDLMVADAIQAHTVAISRLKLSSSDPEVQNYLNLSAQKRIERFTKDLNQPIGDLGKHASAMVAAHKKADAVLEK